MLWNPQKQVAGVLTGARPLATISPYLWRNNLKMTVSNANALSAKDVRALILDRDNTELALIDVRPGGVFGDEHLLWANSVPLTTLEIEILDRVPRLDTKVVLCALDDADGSIIDRAAGKMAEMGYTDISYLRGGVKAWEAAGFEVFSGVNVPSKAFGEFVEHTYDTPRIPATELKRMMDEGENMVVLDSRPMSVEGSLPHGVLLDPFSGAVSGAPPRRVIVSPAARSGCPTRVIRPAPSSAVSVRTIAPKWRNMRSV